MQQEITKTSVFESSDHVQALRMDLLFDRWPVASVYISFLSPPSLFHFEALYKDYELLRAWLIRLSAWS